MRNELTAALAQRVGHGGHHGLRSVVLAMLVIAIVTGVVWLRRRRRSGSGNTRNVGEPPIPPVSAGPKHDPARRAGSAIPPATHRIAPPVSASPVRAQGLTKRYGDKLAVDGLSFVVHSGRVTGFLGPNGAGKSTTMRMIMGLDAPSGGSVTINGLAYHDLSWPLREVGALLEARAMHPGRSAYAHLWMLAQTNHVPRRRVEEVLGLVGLSDVAGQRVGRFSLGMGQRLGIAAALLGDPGVLLFDEPVNGLDIDGIRWVRGLLRGLAGDGRAVLVSSHLMNEMAMTADHVIVIGKGRLIADVPLDQFTAADGYPSVTVRSPDLDRLRPALEAAGATAIPDADGSITVRGMTADEIGDLACRRSIPLHALTIRTASLEEAFIESTEGDLEYRGGRPPTSLTTETRS